LSADGQPVLVARQMPAGVEVILGAVRDERFGPIVMVGMGGLYAESFREVAFRGWPVGEEDVEEMLGEGRLGKVLALERRGRPLDHPALSRLVVTLGRILDDHPQLEQIELNPVIVYESGVCTVDAKLSLGNWGGPA
ncbi:MAG: acetate--CoA ligase family protein, partial [Acidimicrobiia bacterium]